MHSKATDRMKQELWALGTLPPPVTGMTLLTKQVIQRFQVAGPVQFFNWSPGTSRPGIVARIRRVVRVVGSLVKLLLQGRVRNRRIYVVANSRSGLYLTALVVFVARRLGYLICLHHHVYWYIDHYDWRMSWIDNCMGEHGAHIVHCEKMAVDFRNRYQSRCQYYIVCPSVVSNDLESPRTTASRPLRLGMLSNLTFDKGLDLAVQTFTTLRAQGREVSLHLAGPTRSQEAEKFLRQTVTAHPKLVEYSGPVYGEAKKRFFESIDVFLFPTRYESWGIVLNEALAAGVPVITCNRGCTTTVVGPGAGLVVDDSTLFVDQATIQIARWIDSNEEYCRSSQAAIVQANLLHQVGERTLSELAALMFAPVQ